ncbi:MAG: N-acetyl-gamma-glutamyl-phosphate reductase [Candidatus Woesearchaeota archaeon]|nr:N-acetyl-gamma-glutamyl-phosphate reductase [Candidatus Woesearchaeota archaeon]
MNVTIVGGSGYGGGELLRLLLFHPNVSVQQVTSERYAGKFVHKVHPNLRNVTQTKFCSIADLDPCDVLFLCLPHGKAMERIEAFKKLAPKIIDLSGDFRLNDATTYEKWYGHSHTHPALLKEFVYGIPELHREEMKTANYVSSAGCNATAVILGLYPLRDVMEHAVVETKGGSSQGGNKPSAASHHPERAGCYRLYKPTQHRHQAEMLQEVHEQIDFSATTVDMVRGVHAVAHVFLKEDMDEKAIWKLFRAAYGEEPFIRIVKERDGIYRYPEPKLLMGSNYCDIGFAKDTNNRVVVVSAIDNLMKGAAGQAVQAFNIMHGFDETLGLEFPGLHPV